MIRAVGGAAGHPRAWAPPGAPRPLPAAAAEKQSLHAEARETDRVQQARAASQAEVTARDAARLKCIDASGVTLAMTRRDGRAPRGARVVGTVPQHYGANVTLRAALGR